MPLLLTDLYLFFLSIFSFCLVCATDAGARGYWLVRKSFTRLRIKLHIHTQTDREIEVGRLDGKGYEGDNQKKFETGCQRTKLH